MINMKTSRFSNFKILIFQSKTHFLIIFKTLDGAVSIKMTHISPFFFIFQTLQHSKSGVQPCSEHMRDFFFGVHACLIQIHPLLEKSKSAFSLSKLNYLQYKITHMQSFLNFKNAAKCVFCRYRRCPYSQERASQAAKNELDVT